jgi:hypothetical protein
VKAKGEEKPLSLFPYKIKEKGHREWGNQYA